MLSHSLWALAPISHDQDLRCRTIPLDHSPKSPNQPALEEWSALQAVWLHSLQIAERMLRSGVSCQLLIQDVYFTSWVGHFFILLVLDRWSKLGQRILKQYHSLY
jgi:hypothetical protein